MKFNKFLFWVLSVAMFATSCTTGVEPGSDQTPPSDEPEIPTTEYVRLNLFSGCGHDAATDDIEATRAVWDEANGSGPLALKWENVAMDSYETGDMSLLLSDGVKPVYGRFPLEDGVSEVDELYSGLAVTPHEGNPYHAFFKTVNLYDVAYLDSARYCYALNGYAEITENETEGQFFCEMTMPATFTQTASQDPSFLKDYMYMYASTTYKEDQTVLDFQHIPATFRFIVSNSKSSEIALQEVSVSISDDVPIASKTTAVVFDWADGTAKVAYGEGAHFKIGVNTEASLAQGNIYTAYAMALPLGNDLAFQDQTLNVNIKYDDQEQLALKLSGAKLAEVNGSAVYDWISGKSYTIRINIQEDGKVTGEVIEGNRIEISTANAGTYILKYEGGDGLPLADYADICKLPVKELAYYEDFIDVNVAPREAQSIGVYTTSGERQGTIHIPNFRPDYSAEPLYSFGLLSDVHIGRGGADSDKDFETALAHFNAKGVKMTCICGDITQDGNETQYKGYQTVTLTSNTPVYTTTGNHDCTTGGLNHTLWEKYTGQPIVFEQTVENNGKVDHYLFFGMNVWNFGAAYRQTEMDWLADKLEEYRNERCFIFTHLFFPKRAGNLNDIYPSGNWLRGKQLEELEAMCDNYVNTIWFSGHSHWEWELQKYQDRANIYHTYDGINPSSGWCVHVPSCGVPITSNGSSREENKDGSQGAIVEVYENYIDILGIDLKAGKYLPIGRYRLDTSLQEVAEKEEDGGDDVVVPPVTESAYLKASDFVHNPEKVTGATVSDLENGYVELTFTAKKQGFWITSDTFTPYSTSVEIIVEDFQTFSNGEPVEITKGCGFYSSTGAYYTTSTTDATVYPNDGVQFNTSNSGYGDQPLPLTIRMKAKMIFK